MDVIDELADFRADIVQMSRYHSCLERLFLSEPAKWLDLRSLCNGVGDLDSRLETLHQQLEVSAVYVTWLPFPHSGDNPEYAVIVFFYEDAEWSNMAVYNRGYLIELLKS